MDTLFQEPIRRPSPWANSGANTPHIGAEVDESGNVEYKVCIPLPHFYEKRSNLWLVKFGQHFT